MDEPGVSPAKAAARGPPHERGAPETARLNVDARFRGHDTRSMARDMKPARKLRPSALIACLIALALAACALAPEFRTFYLSQEDWRGTALSGRGRLIVADAVAGAAPHIVTVIEIGGVLGLPADPARRMRILDGRAETVTAELERHSVAAADIGVDVRAFAEGANREPWGPLLAKRFAIVVHEY